MNEILKLMNALTSDELASLIKSANEMMETKRQEEAEQARLEKERARQELIAQEKRRQEEIAELQRKLNELQSQPVYIPDEPEEHAAPAEPEVHEEPAAAEPAPAPAPAPRMVNCPHCNQPNTEDSVFCENCGQKIASMPAPAKNNASQAAICPYCGFENPAGSHFCIKCGKKISVAPAPVQPKAPQNAACPHCGYQNPADSTFCENCGQKLTVAPQPAAQTRPAPQPVPQPAPAAKPAAPAAQPAPNAPKPKYADENLKDWVMFPGEYVQRASHEVDFLSPDLGKKFKYHLMITNMRILIKRETASASAASKVAMFSGGIVGALVAESIKNKTNSGPRPFLEIPLAAITNYGMAGKKEFFFEAGERYMLRNKHYDTLLPELIEKAKRSIN